METVLLKIPDVMERLSVGQTKVYELMSSGELRSVKVGRARRVPNHELERFMAELDDTTAAIVDVAHVFAIHSLAEGRPRDALWAAEQAISAAPSEDKPRLDLARALKALGREDEAGADLDKQLFRSHRRRPSAARSLRPYEGGLPPDGSARQRLTVVCRCAAPNRGIGCDGWLAARGLSGACGVAHPSSSRGSRLMRAVRPVAADEVRPLDEQTRRT